MSGRAVMPDPEAQLASLLEKFEPEIAQRGEAVLARVRKLIPPAVELVYDNYNALAIGFSPTESSSQAVVSVVLYPRWVSLFFLQGKALDDPEQLLKGSGSRVRHIVINDEAMVGSRTVRALVKQAVANAEPCFDPTAARRLVIKSISAKQRPRRPGIARNIKK